MDLNYIAGNNTGLLAKLEEFGCDLDSLIYITKDFFTLCDELGLSHCQIGDIFIRLLNAYDVSQGKPLTADLVVYENSRENPTRLRIENRTDSSAVFFSLVPGQEILDKKLALFSCERCLNEFKRIDIKEHFLSKHLT